MGYLLMRIVDVLHYPVHRRDLRRGRSLRACFAIACSDSFEPFPRKASHLIDAACICTTCSYASTLVAVAHDADNFKTDGVAMLPECCRRHLRNAL